MKKLKNLQHQTGVSMVEALVSLLIFTVGALGLAALQLSSSAASADNGQRTLAVWKAQEFIDRIKSNPGLEAAYIAEIGNDNLATIGFDTVAGVFACPAVPTSCSAPGADCSDAEIVAYDVWEVFCEVNTGVLNDGAISNVSNALDTRVYGSSGFNQLEMVLRQLPEDIDADGVDDGTGDMELVLEWVSQEAEGSENITGNILTSLCGNDVNVDPKLDAYCVRFR